VGHIEFPAKRRLPAYKPDTCNSGDHGTGKSREERTGDFAVAAGAADPITPDTGRTTSITVRKTIQRTMPREKVFFIAENASQS